MTTCSNCDTTSLFFIIGKDGNVSDVRVLKGVSEELDAEAVKVVSVGGIILSVCCGAVTLAVKGVLSAIKTFKQ